MAVLTEIGTSVMNRGAQYAPILLTAFGVGGGAAGVKSGSIRRVKPNERGLVLHGRSGKAERDKDHWLIRLMRIEYGDDPSRIKSDWLRDRRKGEPYRQKSPGLRMTLPFWNTIVTIDIGSKSNLIEDLHIDRQDGQHSISARAVWGIGHDKKSPVKAYSKSANIEEIGGIVMGFCEDAIRHTLDTDPSIKVNDREAIETSVKARTEEPLQGFGVVLSHLVVKETAFSPGELQKQGFREGANAISATIGAIAAINSLRPEDSRISG